MDILFWIWLVSSIIATEILFIRIIKSDRTIKSFDDIIAAKIFSLCLGFLGGTCIAGLIYLIRNAPIELLKQIGLGIGVAGAIVIFVGINYYIAKLIIKNR